MFKAEEIEEWNEVFVDGKIQESDIKHPTEQFLVKTLVAYLQKFGYKAELSFADFNGDNSREKRLFLVRLAQNIDVILKYTNKSYSFLYFDLIRPLPKKTSDMLGILLNHYYYYNMFRNEIFSLATGRIDERQNLLFAIEKTQRENDERKQFSEKINEEIKTLSEEVPARKAELESFKTKAEQQKQEFNKEQNQLEGLNKKLSDLRTQNRNLKREIVDDSESLKLKNEVVENDKHIKHNHELQNNLEVTLKDRMETIKNLENLIKSLDDAQKVFASKILEDYKNINAKLKQTKLQHTNKLKEKEALMETISKQEDELKSLSEILKNKPQFEENKSKQLTIIEEKEKTYHSMVRERNCLRSLDENIISQIKEQEEMRDFAVNVLTQLNLNICVRKKF